MTPTPLRRSRKRTRAWPGAIAALVVVAPLLATAATLTTTPASAVTAGPDPTLIVGTLPSAADPSTTGNVVQSFDTATGTAIGSPTAVGTDPWATAITPDGTTAFVANQASGTVTPVTVSSLSTGTNLCMPIGNCPADVATQPEAMAITPSGGTALVANSGENSVSQIVLGSGTPKVVDSALGTTGGTDPFSEPDAIAVTPNGATAYVADYSGGNVVPIDLSNETVGSPISLGAGTDPTALAVTPDGTHLLVADSGTGQVSDVTTATAAVHTFALEPTGIGVMPWALAISPGGTKAWVTDEGNGLLVPVTIATDSPGAPVSVGAFPVSVAIRPDGSAAYVADELADQVAVVDITAGTPSVTKDIPTDGDPRTVAVTPDQAPVAAFSVTPGATGAPTSFDASASATVPAGGALSYSWDFGDGTSPVTTANPTTTHVFAAPGSYDVTLTVTDALGTSTTQVFTGQTVSDDGGATASVTHAVLIQSGAGNATPEAFVAEAGDAAVLPMGLTEGPPSATVGAPTTVGTSPGPVAISPDGSTAYVVDTASNQVTPIDVSTGAASSSATWIGVGSGPSAIALAPNGVKGYVVDESSASLSVITLSTHAVSTVPLDPAAPSALDGIALTPNGATALVVDGTNNTVTPVTLQTDAVGTPVGAAVLTAPDAIAVNPAGTAAYVVDGGSATTSGGLTSLDLTGATPVPASVATIGGPGDHPDAVALSPDGSTAYVLTAPTNGDTATITPVSLSGTNVTVGTSVPVTSATALKGVAVSPDGSAGYATGTLNGTQPVVVPLALASISVTPEAAVDLPAGTSPSGIAVTPDQAPVAELSISPNTAVAAGTPVTFDASASSTQTSPIATYAFDFNDGSPLDTVSAPTASATHAFAVAGTHVASVTLTDTTGTSTTPVYTGQMDLRNGNSAATASQTVTVYPTVTGVVDDRTTTSEGIGGDTVTITGTGFSASPGTTTFEFGTSNPATAVTCVSSTSCTATAPPDVAGPVDVTALVAGQTSPLNGPADQFTYVVASTPTVSAITPNTGVTTGGTSVTITGTDFTGATVVHFGPNVATQVTAVSNNEVTATSPAGAIGPVDVTVTTPGGTSVDVPADVFTYVRATGADASYWMVAADGGIFSYGETQFYGSTGALKLNKPIVGMAATPDGGGYWFVASDGGIFSYGDAHFFGSTGSQHLNAPIVAMAATPDGGGYWLVASDGGIFNYGDAKFYGSAGSLHLNKPIVGMATTNDGGGYWLVASDGGIFTYGDATFFGSTGSMTLDEPIVGLAATPDGGGYWLVASDGGIFNYGDAPFDGSAGALPLNKPVVGMAATPDGGGYWLVATDGGIFTYGDAKFSGSTGAIKLNQPIVGMAGAAVG